MKTRKWIWWTLAVIIALVALTAAGLAGYRVGYVRGLAANPNAKDFLAGPFWHGQGHIQDFDRNFDQRGSVPAQEFGGRQFDRFGECARTKNVQVGVGDCEQVGILSTGDELEVGEGLIFCHDNGVEARKRFLPCGGEQFVERAGDRQQIPADCEKTFEDKMSVNL
jgi:hypothetical protein